MKRKIVIILIGILMISGCTKKQEECTKITKMNPPTLENGEEVIVSLDSLDNISIDNFYSKLKDKNGFDVLIQIINQEIFETEVEEKIEEIKSITNKYVENIKQTENETITFESYIKHLGYKNELEFKSAIYQSYLQDDAIKKYIANTLTDKECKEYYETTSKEKEYQEVLPKLKEELAAKKLAEDTSLVYKAYKYYYEKYNITFYDEDLKNEFDQYLDDLKLQYQ